jgi:hypothetical protein
MSQHFSGTQMTAAVPEQRCGDGEPARHAPEPSAIERYKEIIGMAAEAVETMRAHDRERTGELIVTLAESQDRMAEVIEREKVVRLGVALHWEAAAEALFHERWMTMSPLPQPDLSVPPRRQDEYNTAMDVAYQALEDALQKRSLLRRRTKD